MPPDTGNIPKQRQPRQQRAKQTVNNILDAATLLIQEEGLEQLTTNKLADRSGVNIASIYQYFPNKESIVAAVVEKHVGFATIMLNKELENASDLSIKEAAYQLILSGIRLFEMSDGLIVEMLSSMPNLTNIPGLKMVEFQIMEGCRRFLMKRRDELDVKDLDTAIYVATNSALLVMAKYLFDPPAHLTNEAVAEEIATMITKYFV